MKLDNMFFDFRFVKAEGDSFKISSSSRIISDTEEYAKTYAEKTIAGCEADGREVTLKLKLGIPEHIKEAAGKAFSENDESYAVEISENEIVLSAPNHSGLIFAVSTLKQLIENDNIRKLVLFDYPDKALRGYRVYTPGRKSFDAFKKVVDMLVYYKYNAIMLEVGGAMEYKSHPEINKKWVEFCEEVHQSPYEGERIQHETHTEWQKNSIHADNGDGAFITQDEMRELIAYCKERGLKVTPEVPSLSHCDYIVMAHPELNERKEDTYPDTYCPSNPKSYEILFDLLDEIIDVFKPEYVNIGHDECYTLAKCDKCKDKDPVDLYVGDIIKINDYLKTKGIKSLMWADKCFDNIHLMAYDGKVHGFGGVGDPEWDVPRCYECVGKIPRDVSLFHWYWSLCSFEEEQHLRDLGYTIIFGNFNATKLKGYRKRSKEVVGGYISNWGSFEEEYMQRNGQNYSLVGSSFAFWSEDYDDATMSREIEIKVKEELHSRYRKTLSENVIEVVHTTDLERGYKAFYDGYYIVPEDWTIGQHVVTYTDGTKASLPIVYGYNIRANEAKAITDSGSEEAKATGYVEIIGASFPMIENGEMVYKTAYSNPYPEKEIKSIEVCAKDGINIRARYNV